MSPNLLRSLCDPSNPMLTKDNILSLKDETVRNNVIAKWVVEYGFEEIHPEKIPEPPYKLKEYRDENRRRKVTNQRPLEFGSDFWRNPDIAGYLDTEWILRLRNRDNYEWLNKCLSWLNPGEDDPYIAKFKQRIKEYDEFFGNFGIEDLPPEAHQIAKLFCAQNVKEEWE